MDITTKEYCGVTYLTPKTFEFAYVTIDEYPSFCGAGEGIGDLIVPERIGGHSCSHICHCHDHSWAICKNTFVEFMVGNMMFLFNLITYLMRFGNPWKRGKNMLIGLGYAIVVSSPVGWKIFKRIKKYEVE
ncbi:MAG: hypothetical protein KJ630_19150 [Proteobacteria bacterium]|nr:hypothetical protein [Pseudomonadota bacterium]